MKTGGLAAGLKTGSFAAGFRTGGFAAPVPPLKKVTIKAEGSLGLKFEKESMVVRNVKAGTPGAVHKIEVGWEVQKVGSNTMQMTDVSKMEKADIVALIKRTGRPLSLAFKLPAKASEAAARLSPRPRSPFIPRFAPCGPGFCHVFAVWEHSIMIFRELCGG